MFVQYTEPYPWQRFHAAYWRWALKPEVELYKYHYGGEGPCFGELTAVGPDRSGEDARCHMGVQVSRNVHLVYSTGMML